MNDPDWRDEIVCNFRMSGDLSPGFKLYAGEKKLLDAISETRAKPDGSPLDFNVTRYYASLAGNNVNDPVRRQFMPSFHELEVKKYELEDPLGEEDHAPCERLIHRYSNRALLLTTSECAVYCRHCFRRRFSGRGGGPIGDPALKQVLGYLASHTEIMELLISGGDPLILTDEGLEKIFTAIRKVRDDLVFRICSRVPVVFPRRIGPDTVDMLSRFQPVWMVTQFNHPRELADAAGTAVGHLVDAGIPVVNQTVLLKGINDSSAVLAELFQGLLAMRVKPYYLFQGDLARGTAHFRTTIESGRLIMEDLKRRVSGLALPVYAVDLPGGGGKINLMETSAVKIEKGFHYFRNYEGKLFRYPSF